MKPLRIIRIIGESSKSIQVLLPENRIVELWKPGYGYYYTTESGCTYLEVCYEIYAQYAPYHYHTEEQIRHLKFLKSRIKGASYCEYYDSIRVWLSHKWKMPGRYKETKCFFQYINSELEVIVSIKGRNVHYIKEEILLHDAIIENYQELIDGKELERIPVDVDPALYDSGVKCYKPYPSYAHQERAFRKGLGLKTFGLLAEAGTCKSKVIIDLICNRYLEQKIDKAVIFCPVSTGPNFTEQIETWCKIEHWIYIVNDKTNTDTKLPDGFGFVIIGHESIQLHIGIGRVFEFSQQIIDENTFLVSDESHYAKGPDANRANNLVSLSRITQYKAIMTGSFFSENVGDAYMQLQFLSPLILKQHNWERFQKKYLLLGGRTGTEIVGYKNLEHLVGLFEPYVFQINKKDCFDLPKLKTQTLKIDMTPKQKEKYSQVKEELLETIMEEEIYNGTIFRFLTQLQQITCGFYKEESFPSFKLECLRDFIDVHPEEQIVIFCKYTREIEDVSHFIQKHYNETPAIFHGNNRKTRDQEKEEFTKNRRRFLIANMRTGGTGLNGMQAAHILLFYSMMFEYKFYEQPIGRIERPGQTSEMLVANIYVNSGIEQKIRRAIDRKENMVNQIQRIINDKQKLKEYIDEL